MATIFGHALVAGTISWVSKPNKKLLLWCCLSSMLPDADVIGFSFDIAYGSLFGHRGFTHSLFFALLWALLVKTLIFKDVKNNTKQSVIIILLLFIATASHGVLDACTTGGKGVAFLSPFSNHRYFFPWQFIQVSPIGASKFMSERGLAILINEGLFLGLPCFIALVLTKIKVNKKAA